MRLLTFQDQQNKICLGVLHGEEHVLDVLATFPTLRKFQCGSGGPSWRRMLDQIALAILQDFLHRHEEDIASSPHLHSLSCVNLLAPVHDPCNVLCIGLNYHDHAHESGAKIPDEPVVFSKLASTVVAPMATIALPEPAVSKEVDYEVELVIVISKDCKCASKDTAMEYVAGYTVANDLSARNLQLRSNAGQWTLGKSLDQFTPVGPFLVTKDEVKDVHNLELSCSINGNVMQRSSTGQMIFKVTDIVCFISRMLTLRAGDLILTGTPSGVGFARQPPVFIRPGDTVRCSVEGLGHVENRFVRNDEMVPASATDIPCANPFALEVTEKPVSENDWFLITGGCGLFGVYIAQRLLLDPKAKVAMVDLRKNEHILDQVFLGDSSFSRSRIDFVEGDVSDSNLLPEVLSRYSPRLLFHLAAVQIPTVKHSPSLGAVVNVLGSINVLEAAANAGIPVVYASSAGIYGPFSDYESGKVPHSRFHDSRTLYGCFKQCIEHSARIYFQDRGLSSVGLRPLTVFGVGREVGLTSSPTKAIKAAVVRQPYSVGFQGVTGFNFIEDVANAFVLCGQAMLLGQTGAHLFALRGHVLSVEDFLSKVRAATKWNDLKCGGTFLHDVIACDVDESGLHEFLAKSGLVYKETSIDDAVKKVVDHFSLLRREGALPLDDL